MARVVKSFLVKHKDRLSCVVDTIVADSLVITQYIGLSPEGSNLNPHERIGDIAIF